MREKEFDKSRLLVLLTLLPLICILPWLLMTGPADLGRKFGIVLMFKFQTLMDPANVGPSLQHATTKPDGPAPTAGVMSDLLFSRAAAARLYSIAATIMLIIVAVVSGGFGWLSAWKTSAPRRDRVMFCWLAPIMLLGVLWSIVPGEEYRIYDLLGQDVFKASVGKIDAGAGLTLLNWQQAINNTVLAIAGVGLAFAAALIAIRAYRLDHSSSWSEFHELKNRLDIVLLCSALLLAAGVIDAKQWSALPLPFFADDKLAAAYSGLTSAFIAIESVCFVAALVAMYLPAASMLERGRQRMLKDGTPAVPEGAASKAPRIGFVASDLLRAAAILAPVLVGPVASFANLKIPG